MKNYLISKKYNNWCKRSRKRCSFYQTRINVTICNSNELEELKINLSVTEEALKFNEDKLEELEGKYNTLRDMYLELYVMYVQAKNKGKIDKSMKNKHKEFRKNMTDDKVYDEIELPF